MRICLVKWVDAVTEQADEVGPAHAQLATLTEVGYLLDETAEAICIGMESHEEGEVRPGRFRLHIPRSNIRELYVTDVGRAFGKRSLVWQS